MVKSEMHRNRDDIETVRNLLGLIDDTLQYKEANEAFERIINYFIEKELNLQDMMLSHED